MDMSFKATYIAFKQAMLFLQILKATKFYLNYVKNIFVICATLSIDLTKLSMISWLKYVCLIGLSEKHNLKLANKRILDSWCNYCFLPSWYLMVSDLRIFIIFVQLLNLIGSSK